MQTQAKLLGYLGLIPFIALPFLITLDVISYFEGLIFFNQYSAIIVSFLGGVWWYESIKNTHKSAMLHFAAIPSIVAFLCLIMMPPEMMIWLTLVLFLCILAYELYQLQLEDWYKTLRINLTTVVSGCHLMMLWLVYQL